MATVSKLDENRWQVHMGSRTKSEVTIEVHMSRAMAEFAAREVEAMLDELDEARWAASFAKSPDVLERLAAEAEQEDRAGLTEALDPDSL